MTSKMIAANAGKSSAEAGNDQENPGGWILEQDLLYRLSDETPAYNRDEIRVTQADGSRTIEARTRRAGELLGLLRAGAAAALAPKLVAEAQAPAVPAVTVDSDGEAFRTAARLGLTLRFYGGCAQSSIPGTPSAYEVVSGADRATAMREAVQRAYAVISSGWDAQRLGDTLQQAAPQPEAEARAVPRVCNRCNGTGKVKLHNWGTGGDREQDCWDCREVEAPQPEAQAQAQAVPAVDLPDVEDMAHSCVQEALSFGLDHDLVHRWMRSVMDKTAAALAAPQPEAAVDERTAFDQWVEDYALKLEPNWSTATEADCFAAWQARAALAAQGGV